MSAGAYHILAGASGQGGYYLTRSLRFRSSASAYLNRTPATATNRKTWTWSAWVKRGTLGVVNRLFAADDGSSSTDQDYNTLLFNSSNQLQFSGNLTDFRTTTAVYRDSSAWYHIVFVTDTTQATASNRFKLYVNGVEVTAFGTANNPSQNTDLAVNNNIAHYIGSIAPAGASYFDGYQAEVNFIDGQALTPSSFGETSASTGVWQPKKYAGTYGANGFYLPFSNNSSTTTLGNDFSGNGNNWTTNNISLTAGSTYDSMTDVPTLTSATASNFSVLNPLSKGTSQTSVIEGNLYAVPISGGSNWGTVFSSIAIPSSGKYYIEGTAVAITGSGNSSSLGVVDSASFIPTNTTILYTYSTGEGFDGILAHLFNDYVSPISDGSQGTNVTGITGTTVNLMLALDVDNGKVYAGYNGTWLNSGNPAGNTGEIATRTFSPTDVVAGHTSWNGSNDQSQYYNFGQRPFAYTPPTGFVALNTFNLPTPTIGATASTQANKYFDATLYTGNGGTQSITNSGSMQPDFVWYKSRSSGTWNHGLFDSVRGTTKQLFSNSTGAEGTFSGVTAFNSNGFTVGSDNGGNENGGSMVAWQWRASNATAVTNTAGSITSTVSANTNAGFSVVTYTGTGANATVGHGLGVAPKMMIVKERGAVRNWGVYHASLGNASAIYLNLTNASSSQPTFWNSTTPTSTVFSVGTDDTTNKSTSTYVAYCFSEVAGYSKFGSYTGNASDDGPFIYTGFKPKFLMVKQINIANDWVIVDSARNPSNVVNGVLYPNLSAAEAFANNIDFVSNGFKLRRSGIMNGSGATIIYAAFAETPTKFALAR